VEKFGESEFVLSSLKILTLTVIMITCLVIASGGGPDKDARGFRYWQRPGAFAEYLQPGALGKLLGFWACMVQSCFAYTGTEVVGVAFGETANPRKNIPSAIRQTLWRIVVFYIIGVFLLGMCVPYYDESLIGATKAKTSAKASPFVLAISLAGIKIMPDIINAALLVFVISAANTGKSGANSSCPLKSLTNFVDVYVGARTLHSLAREGQAPKIFERTNKQGVPLWGVGFTSLFILLAYMNVSASSATVFGYFVSLVTVFGTLNWISVLVSYVYFCRVMKVQGIPRSKLPYRGPLQPYGAWWALGLTCTIVFFNGKSTLSVETKAHLTGGHLSGEHRGLEALPQDETSAPRNCRISRIFLSIGMRVGKSLTCPHS
jgi:amino acid transporter